MKTLIIFFSMIVLLNSTNAYGDGQNDSGHDAAHFALSYAITTTVYGLAKLDKDSSRLDRIAAGIFAGVVAGFVKEAYDSTLLQQPFDYRDMSLDLLGIGTSVGCILLFDF